jgi:spoIIIJ-associated protein
MNRRNESTGHTEDRTGAVKGAREDLEQLLERMGYGDAAVEAFDDGDDVLLHVESPDAGRLIGRGAQVLDALQYILNRIRFQRDREALHCVVDIERYRERKRDRLLKEALEAADTVEETGRPFKFSPMQAGDRRIIHRALKKRDTVETESEPVGDEGLKRVVVSPVYDEDEEDRQTFSAEEDYEDSDDEQPYEEDAEAPEDEPNGNRWD